MGRCLCKLLLNLLGSLLRYPWNLMESYLLGCPLKPAGGQLCWLSSILAESLQYLPLAKLNTVPGDKEGMYTRFGYSSLRFVLFRFLYRAKSS